MSSRAEQKRKLREEREERAQRTAQVSARKRRLSILAGVAGVAVVVVVALVLLGQGEDKGPSGLGDGEQVTGVAEARELLEGIAQDGTSLGKASAPVTLVEYVDLQCPFCAQYATQVSPTLVERYVRPGRLRIEQRTVAILGGESEDAARHSAAAAGKDRMFQFNDLFFRNQGQENSGYITPGFLDRIARNAGLNAAALTRAADSPTAEHGAGAAQRAFTDAGYSSTPSFTLGRTGGRQQQLEVTDLAPESFTGPIDRLLGSG